MPIFVVFGLGELRCALPLAAVERVVAAVAVTILPGAPAIVMGAIDVAGRIVPVFNLRRLFRMPEHELGINDQLVLARAMNRSVALVVDEAYGVVDRDESSVVASDRIVPGLDRLDGVLQMDGGLVLIQNLDQLLSSDEAHSLDAALDGRSSC